MLSYLSEYEQFFGPLRLLHYISVRTVLGAGTSLFIGFIIGPWLIARFRALKFGQHYDDDRTGDLGQRFDKKNTPTMGGLIIFISVFLSTVLWATPNVWVFVALFVYTVLTVAGWRDDYLKVVHGNRDGISSWEKIGWQSLATVVALGVLLWHLGLWDHGLRGGQHQIRGILAAQLCAGHGGIDDHLWGADRRVHGFSLV